MNDDRKEVLLANGLTHRRANELRSMLVKTVKHIWVLVFETTKVDNYDVYIANEWGGTPSKEQKELSMALATGFIDEEQHVDTLRQEEYIDVTDDIQVVSQ